MRRVGEMTLEGVGLLVMSLHLQRQIAKLKKKILGLGAQVEGAVADATRAVEQRDNDLAGEVIRKDAEIDQAKVEMEEACLHTLALHQPVAFDLRYIVATLKIAGELERVGDLAVNLAQLAQRSTEHPPADPPPFDLIGMTRQLRQMVKYSLDALVMIDPAMAREVIEADSEIDAIHRGMYRRVEEAIRQDPELVQTYLLLLSVSRHIERMADHAVNVAAEVIYTATGEVVMHRDRSTPTSAS